MTGRIAIGIAFSAGLLAAAAGCRGLGDQSTESDASSVSPLRTNARYLSGEAPAAIDQPQPDLEDTTHVRLAYARWMEGVGNFPEARTHYERVVQQEPQQVDALLGLARIDQLSGRVDEAEERFLAAIRLQPESPRVLHAAGRFYAAQERWAEAEAMFHKAVLADPTGGRYRHDLAAALVHLGEVEAALSQYAQTVDDGAAHYNVGLLLRQTGDLQAAERQMLSALAKQPELQQAQYWLEEIRRERNEAVADQRPAAEPIQQAGYAVPADRSRGGHSVEPAGR